VKRYRATPVEAARFVGPNWLEICRWANPGFEPGAEWYEADDTPIAPSGEIRDDGPFSLSVMVTNEDELFAERGEWIVRRVHDSAFTVLTDEEFRQAYEEDS
jgi:hypothetical protein